MNATAVLYAALSEKVGLEVVPESEVATESQVRFMVRVKTGTMTTRWLAVLDHILSVPLPGCGLDVSKHYFRSPHLRFGWRIIIQSKNLPEAISHLAELVRTAQLKVIQTREQEVPLQGSPNRSPRAGFTNPDSSGPPGR
jgi:hypothetical protein